MNIKCVLRINFPVKTLQNDRNGYAFNACRPNEDKRGQDVTENRSVFGKAVLGCKMLNGIVFVRYLNGRQE